MRMIAEDSRGSGLERVLSALNSPQYEWRTVDGIAKEAGIEVAEVMSILRQLADQNLVVKSALPSKEGLDLYTSREKFHERASVAEKLLGSLMNRIL